MVITIKKIIRITKLIIIALFMASVETGMLLKSNQHLVLINDRWYIKEDQNDKI